MTIIPYGQSSPTPRARRPPTSYVGCGKANKDVGTLHRGGAKVGRYGLLGREKNQNVRPMCVRLLSTAVVLFAVIR